MKAKKIIKAIAKLAAVTGVTFISPTRWAKMNGESRERIRQKYDDEDDYEDYYSLSDYDEPDCGINRRHATEIDKS